MSRIKILFLISLTLIALFAIVSYWMYSTLSSPAEHEKAQQFIQIEKGTAPSAIVDKLAAEGVIKYPLTTKVYLRLFGDASKLKAGEYEFSSPITPLQVLAELEKGEERVTKLVIPEGFTRFDIAKRIVEKFPQDPAVTEAEVLVLMEQTEKIRDLAPEAKNLEGYMYPSTYSFPKETSPAVIINAMTSQFLKIWKPEWTARAKAIGRTPHEIVTLASLIETESGIESERPVVASVIYNRLNKSVPLGIDQTVVYIAKMLNRWDGTINRSDLDVDSPYNTRRYGGIPPGPISSVSESAIAAALSPAQTDYLYYVRNVDLNDGSHWFYSSASEFERGKARYQQWLEKERQEKRAAETSNENK